MTSNSLERYEYTAPTMGTVLRIILYSESPAAAEQAIHAALDEIERLIPILNNYDPKSEVSGLTDSCNNPIRVSSDLQSVLEHAIRWHGLTDGALDISLGSIFRVWSQCRKERRLPTSDEWTRSIFTSGWHVWSFDRPSDSSLPATVETISEEVIIDTSGLATGYIIDRAFEAMQRTGHECVLIDIGGDIRMGTPPPESEGWVVAVAGVQANKRPVCNLRLQSCAITTSGDLNQFVEIDGTRYSHLIDPKTKRPLQRSQTATAVAATCVDADAGATSLCVLGVERASQLFHNLPLTEAFVFESSSESRTGTHSIPRFRHLFNE